MKACVEKRKQSQHPSKAGKIRQRENFSQRRDRERDEKKSQCPLACRMCNELDRIGAKAPLQGAPSEPR